MQEPLKMVQISTLDNALSALSKSTRALVIVELDKAVRDTCVDYHRETARETQELLWEEIKSLQTITASLKRVDQEYDDIIRTASVNNSDPEGKGIDEIKGNSHL